MPPREHNQFDDELGTIAFNATRQNRYNIPYPEEQEIPHFNEDRWEREEVYVGQAFEPRYARIGQIEPLYGTVKQKTINLEMNFNIDTDLSENTTDWISIYLIEGGLTIGRINTIATTPYTHFISEYLYHSPTVSKTPKYTMLDLLPKLIEKCEAYDYIEHLVIEIYETETRNFLQKEFFEKHGFEVMYKIGNKIWMILNLQ